MYHTIYQEVHKSIVSTLTTAFQEACHALVARNPVISPGLVGDLSVEPFCSKGSKAFVVVASCSPGSLTDTVSRKHSKYEKASSDVRAILFEFFMELTGNWAPENDKVSGSL
jgi:hypothetical protein